MAFETSFVSSEQFTLPDEVFQKLRSSAFLTGISPSKEQTRGVVEGALNVGAQRASEREAQARQFALGQEQLEVQRQRTEASLALGFEQTRLQEKGLKSKERGMFIAGGGIAVGLALFAPIFSSTGGGKTSLWSKIWT